ncbi:MAG: DUF1566 domain-containing protein [bacterium]|nr:DUF1566 domain-containing protein [bacterium]
MKNRLVILFIFTLTATICFFTALFVDGQQSIKGIDGNAGKRWAIIIGINDYKDKRIVDLKTPRKDVKMIEAVLKKNGQFDEIHTMSDELDPGNENFPKKEQVLKKLQSLKAAIKPEDMVMFFFSGHGISNSTGDGFLVLANSYKENLNGTSLKVKDLVKWLGELKVKKSLILLDANREKFLVGKDMKLKGIPVEDFGSNQPGGIFYAATPGSNSYENNGNPGIFTGYIADGIKGLADVTANGGNNDKIVSFSELATYLRSGVSQWAKDSGRNQTPLAKIVGDGKLAVSTYGALPTKSAFLKASAGAVSAVRLRTEAKSLKNSDVKAFTTKFGFFDKKDNPNRSFKNSFEAKDIGGDKVVMDNATGLMWHQSGSDKGMEFEQAQTWVNDLNQKKYAGFSNWRMPSLEEAYSILDSSKKNGSLYIDPAFSATQTNIWSCDLSGKEAAWILFFNMGKANRDYFFNYVFIRPVRTN